MGEELNEPKYNVGLVLKNALEWKQWMADDLRILIDLVQDDGLNQHRVEELVMHHLDTYRLVNDVFDSVSGGLGEPLFSLPSIERLQKLMPTLDFTAEGVEQLLEPMLELEVGELSNTLEQEILRKGVDSGSAEDAVRVDDEIEIDDDTNEVEDVVDDGFDSSDEYVDDISDGLSELTSIQSNTYRTLDIVGEVWGNKSDMISKLTSSKSNDGVDVDVRD